MTRLDIAGGGYREASGLLHFANVWAAQVVGRLSDDLSDTAAMAGDSSFADRWASEYDAAAAATCAALADAAGALGTLGRYAFASLENHTRAELASTLGEVRLLDEVSLGTDDWVDVAAPAPPGSLGGDPSSLPGWATWILDHVEGFVWPDADLDRLRSAGAAWRRAGDGLDEVAGYPRRAINELWTECSPEILPATAAIGRAVAAIGDLADRCRDLGALCEGYAAAVEAQRTAILELVSDLLRDAAIIQAAGFALGFVSFGTANGGAVAVNVAKIAAAAPRLKRVLDLLRRYADEAAGALAGTRVAAAGAGARLRPMSEARLLMSAEVGKAGARGGRARSFLWAHEGGRMGAHTIKKHVGKSDDFLRQRLIDEPGKELVSTFTDEATAARSIQTVLALRSRTLTKFLGSSKRTTAFEAPVANPGRIMNRAGDVFEGTSVHLYLKKDKSMPDGYRIITAYVNP